MKKKKDMAHQESRIHVKLFRLCTPCRLGSCTLCSLPYFSSFRNRARHGQVVGQMGQVSTATRQGKERDGAQTKEEGLKRGMGRSRETFRRSTAVGIHTIDDDDDATLGRGCTLTRAYR